MICYIPDKIPEEFNRNLVDWAAGGPKEEGWTRTGNPYPAPVIRLTGYKIGKVNIEDALSKNPIETNKWHIRFLETCSDDISKWKDTLYYKEYLKPRYDEDAAFNRASTFLKLFEDIQDHDIQQKVWIAKINMKTCDYFRFNGCHRICAAKVLGKTTVPAYIFSTSKD